MRMMVKYRESGRQVHTHTGRRPKSNASATWLDQPHRTLAIVYFVVAIPHTITFCRQLHNHAAMLPNNGQEFCSIAEIKGCLTPRHQWHTNLTLKILSVCAPVGLFDIEIVFFATNLFMLFA